RLLQPRRGFAACHAPALKGGRPFRGGLAAAQIFCRPDYFRTRYPDRQPIDGESQGIKQRRVPAVYRMKGDSTIWLRGETLSYLLSLPRRPDGPQLNPMPM